MTATSGRSEPQKSLPDVDIRLRTVEVERRSAPNDRVPVRMIGPRLKSLAGFFGDGMHGLERGVHRFNLAHFADTPANLTAVSRSAEAGVLVITCSDLGIDRTHYWVITPLTSMCCRTPATW